MNEYSFMNKNYIIKYKTLIRVMVFNVVPIFISKIQQYPINLLKKLLKAKFTNVSK